MVVARAAAYSHVGKVRSNNQDSGYIGQNLFLVADGMGGHAGGDVASALAVKRIREADRAYRTDTEAGLAMQAAIIAANGVLSQTVFEHPDLTGMGTTVCALALAGKRLTVAHIGDSRAYRLRNGKVTQITTDHTFVQRLVDDGRITEAEAAVHPRRSVLMRVLGDVDASPDVDLLHYDAQPGDRWLLCSDGLSGVVSAAELRKILRMDADPEQVADRLIEASLSAGAPDNTTAVVVDLVADSQYAEVEPVVVGSAAKPLDYEPEPAAATRATWLPSLRHPLHHASGPSHFEPQAEEYLDALIEEDRRRSLRRRLLWLTGLVVLIGAIVAGVVLGYQWTQTRYYVGVSDDGYVSVYRGIQQDLGPISLSEVYEKSATTVDDLPVFDREQLQDTINADSLTEARHIVRRISRDIP